MHLSSIDYRLKFRKITDETFREGENRMRYKTVTEEIYEESIEQGLEQGRSEVIRSFIELGVLTDEQIASALKMTVDAIKSMRLELKQIN